MAEDDKAAASKPCQEQSHPKEGDKQVRRRAPDQDVLPGILGKQLKAAYSELLNTPIPDAFNDLIKRLESNESSDRPPQPRREESDQ